MKAWRRVAQAGLLVLAVIAIYSPVLHGGWLWDDNFDITENLLLRDVSGLGKIWFAPTTLDYYPIKFTVQWLQWQLWGDHVAGYHATNIALHLAGVMLFWRLLARLGVRLAWFGALLFAIHPLAVESVAWMAELKNVLALPPLLLAVEAWLDHDLNHSRRSYWRAVGWFLVSMLCKSSGVMLPIALLLLTRWRRGRIGRRDLQLALPFLAISFTLGAVTMWFQYSRVIRDAVIPLGGPLTRLLLGGSTLAFYAGKSIWPAQLIPIYPPWAVDGSRWWLVAPWILCLGLLLWLWRRPTPGARHALLGLGWFVLHLLPFVGFAAISYMRFSWVMDHIAYVPLLGLCGLAAAGLGEILARCDGLLRQTLLGATAAVVIFFATLAQRHARHFVTSEALWSYELQHYPESPVAHNNYGLALAQKGDPAGARLNYSQAVALDPAYFEARTNLGNALAAENRTDEAIRELRTAAQLQPRSPAAHYNLALALNRGKAYPEAFAELNTTISLKPGWADAWNARGVLLRQLGKAADALVDLQKAAQFAPDSAEMHADLALALIDAGRVDDAIRQFKAAVQLQPGNADTQLNLGITLLRANRAGEAVAPLQAASRLKPADVRAHFNLGNALLASGQAAPAVTAFERAAALVPNHPQIEAPLARALAQAGRVEEARTHYAHARQQDPSLPPPPF